MSPGRSGPPAVLADGPVGSDRPTAAVRHARIDPRAGRRRPTGTGLGRKGSWKRRAGTPNDPEAPSDGYATGLAVFVLRQTGVPAADPAIGRGVDWLLSHQRASGRWFTRSVNNDKHHYITNAGTAFAVLALEACGVAEEESRGHSTSIRNGEK